ncbi:MAG: TraB/GumN family protein [Luteimonas sp.]
MRLRLLCLLLTCIATATHAQGGSPPAPQPNAAPSPASDVVDLDTVVVSGLQPGPGMWKVSKGDHVLYILGTLSPLPRRMEWLSKDVEATIAQAQAVIEPPSVELDSDIGLFGKLTLLPSLLKARKNPDGRTLQQSVSPQLYARWQVLKARYIGSDAGIESWRPIFAAQELYESAMKRSGLSQKNIVEGVVERAAKKHRVPRLSTETTFKVSNPKTVIREFNTTTLADADCFAKTMTRIEADLGTMQVHANAWAVGDIAALRDLPLENQYAACTQAITDSALAQKLGLGNVRARIAGTWMAAAEKSLADNRVSFATMSIPLLLRDDGFIARLRAKGYAIEEPQ